MAVMGNSAATQDPTLATNGNGMLARDDVKFAIAAMVFLIQLAGLVWGAAKIDSSVRSLERSTDNLTTTVGKLDDSVDDLAARVRVVEERTTTRGRGGGNP